MAEPSILITGCSSGIGYAAAHALKKRGWRVFAGVRKAEDQARLAGEGLEAVLLDYADEASITRATDEVFAKTGGRLDALFNNGGFGQPGALEDLPTDLLRAQFEANVFGWHTLIRRVLPAMRRQNSGRIVNCSSILGLVAAPFRGAYVASKHAVEGLSDTLRLELAGTGIAVVIIEPGPIASRFIERGRDRAKATIDIERSPHRDAYEHQLARLGSGGPGARFRLPPEAVVAKLIHALESPHPRARYRVTLPAHAAALMKRLLPTRLLDRLLQLQR